MASCKATISTQCNFFIRERTTKYVQVKPDVKSKGQCFRPEVSHRLTHTDQSVHTADKCIQCVTTVITSRRKTADVGVQHGTFDAVAIAIEKVLYVLRTMPSFDTLRYEVSSCGNVQTLVITAPNLGNIDFMPVNPVSIVVANGLLYYVLAYKPKDVINLWENEQFDIAAVIRMLNKLLAASQKHLCLGIVSEATGAHHSASLRKFEWPYEHMRSRDCDVLFDSAEHDRRDICVKCAIAQQCIRRSVKRKINLTPVRKAKRARFNSRCPFSYLTPRSKRIRLQRATRVRQVLIKNVSKLVKKIENVVTLNDEQSDEMDGIVKVIQRDFPTELSDAMTANMNATQSEALKQIWQRDVNGRHARERAAFRRDQAHNQLGSRSNRWSAITYRIALAVYCRSPAAYRALCKFNVLKLPSCASVSSKCKNYNEPPGINHAYLWEQRLKYEVIKDEASQSGQKIPLGEGILIFDEVKVVEKVMWNSKNHAFQGLAMDETELMQLNDVVSDQGQTEPAKYVLQFMWRDLSHKFDVIGPYFTCKQSLSEQYLSSCLFETMHAMYSYGFGISCLVCDGASSNLTVMKSLLGLSGSIGYTTCGDVRDHSVNASFVNPFENRPCHIVICPSHELKSLVSALHSSRPFGSKNFCKDGVVFGWSCIRSMKVREDTRLAAGQMRRVRGLTEAYIERDSWTRLNVQPSKIMQQDEVLMELYSHGTDTKDAASLETYRYLKACNLLFENGLLSKEPVFSTSSTVIQNIKKGYEYFEQWCEDVLSHSVDKEQQVKQFLAWQTWDLLRLCVYGAIDLVEDFTKRNPGYFVVLSRINGSVVESLFSQLKYAAGGKLSAVNYPWARKAVMTKGNVSGECSSNMCYRNDKLDIEEV